MPDPIRVSQVISSPSRFRAFTVPAGVILAVLTGQACLASPLARENSFIGSHTCASCHPAQAKSQLAGNMAKAAFRPRNHPLLERFKNLSAGAPGIRYSLDIKYDQLVMTVSNGQAVLPIAIDWALGAGVNAVTFISAAEGNRYLEHRVSYYSDTGRLDFTPGRSKLKFQSLAEAAGHYNESAEAFRCLACHTTGTRMDSAGRLTIGEPGVRCEACHGPGRLHLEAVRRKDWDNARATIGNPRKVSAERLIASCGTCHRLPVKEASAVDWRDPATTRFQPIGLTRSHCYLQSGGALSCISCHDAHSDVRRDAEYYSQICGRCHSPSINPPARACRSEKSGCAVCHMPRVAALPHISFTNHWIGVYGEKNHLVPRE